MKISKLNNIIAQFRKNNNHTIYKFGLCSEFAISLQHYLHSGQLYKAGLFHTCLKYKDHYCDINGCYPQQHYRSTVPSVSLSPATTKEIKHIKKLLNKQAVQKIIKNLKQSSREIR